MSRVLWIGDAGNVSGFGNVANNIGSRLVTDHGHEVHALAANWEGDPHGTPMQLWRANSEDPLDTFGQRRIYEVLARVQPDVVIVLNDPHVITRLMFYNDFDPQQALRRYRPVIAYFTVDGESLPESYKVFSRYTRPVAMSAFGQQQVEGSDLIYHGIDHETFRVASDEQPILTSEGDVVTSRVTAKAAFGYEPDTFLILRVDRNGWRKDYGSTWKALVPIARAHDDVRVHFHCAGNDTAGGPIMPALWSREHEISDRFRLSANFKLAPNDLATLYNAADMFVSTSMGEGFGLTLLEAAACGLPIVAQNCSAIPEVVGPGGILLEPGPRITSPSGQDLRLADIPAFTQAIEMLYRESDLRAELASQAVAHAATFDWERPAAQFDRHIVDIHQASLAEGHDPGETAPEAQSSPT